MTKSLRSGIKDRPRQSVDSNLLASSELREQRALNLWRIFVKANELSHNPTTPKRTLSTDARL